MGACPDAERRLLAVCAEVDGRCDDVARGRAAPRQEGGREPEGEERPHRRSPMSRSRSFTYFPKTTSVEKDSSNVACALRAWRSRRAGSAR